MSPISALKRFIARQFAERRPLLFMLKKILADPRLIRALFADRSFILFMLKKASDDPDFERRYFSGHYFTKLLNDNYQFKGAAVKEKYSRRGRLILNDMPRFDTGRILDAMRSASVDVIDYRVNADSFARWYQSVDYETHFPKYCDQFSKGNTLLRKAFEHYLSLELMQPRSHEVFMDVASSNSVVPEIVARHCGIKKCYVQDLCYPEGIHGDIIGSNASSIPLENSSVDLMTLHNSIEHFEDYADLAFLDEASRLLRPGGRLCIIPLFMAESLAVMTDEMMWKIWGVPDFKEETHVHILEHFGNRHAQYLSAEYLKSAFIEPVTDRMKASVYYIQNHAEVDGASPFALMYRASRD